MAALRHQRGSCRAELRHPEGGLTAATQFARKRASYMEEDRLRTMGLTPLLIAPSGACLALAFTSPVG